jgi:hypothetical protein
MPGGSDLARGGTTVLLENLDGLDRLKHIASVALNVVLNSEAMNI